MAQSSCGAVEHRVRMPAAHVVVVAGRADEQGKPAGRPEKLLNCFVRFLALIERAGNALGTLAFTWATVVLLGGYPTVLVGNDFWFAAVIVFLEALRMFGRNNRLDYQLFFHTRGALKPLGWSGLIIIVCLTNAWNYTLKLTNDDQIAPAVLLLMLALVVPGLFQSSRSLERLSERLYHAISLWSPLVAILLMVPLIAKFTSENKVAKWIVFSILLLVVLLLTGRRLADHVMGNKQVFWRRLVLNLCMFVSLVILIFMPDDPSNRVLVFFYELYALVLVSFGNLQIPAAVTRVVLSLLRLANQNDYYGDDKDNPGKVNLRSTLNIFYGMVLVQGTLYVVACILEFFSFIPRRLLARRGGFGGRFGLESVSLYYAYALEKSMEGDVLGPKKTGIISFTMHCLDSDMPKMQLHGIRTMHSLLRREATRPRVLSRLTTSTKTMTRLVDILGWSGEGYTEIRLLAAKVIAELATSLRVTAAPGIVQVVSALMDYGKQQKRGHPLLQDAEAKHKTMSGSVLNGNDGNDNQKERTAEDLGTGRLLETQDRSTQCGAANNENPWKLRWWKRISGIWSIPNEEQLTEEDLLPALGMSILDGLASCDKANCVEISRETGLIPKILDFTGYCNFEREAQQRVLVKSSVKLLHSLTGFDGEVGVTLRHKICKHPFLPRNLAHILGDSTSSQELRKLVEGIIRNLAIDTNARQAIGRSKLIISRLMHAFLTPDGTSSTDDDRLLRKVAGQALAMLAMDNANNCLAMLRESGYALVKELTRMICDDRHRCIAASLLRSFCLHARHELKGTDLKGLSSRLREVLERILHAEGTELEILIGLSSQISKAIPKEFARELEHGEIKDEAFMKRLVDVLDSNMSPSGDCPGIRRMILEQAVNLMEHNSRYVHCFNNRRMIDALSMVEETVSDAENYNIILGDIGVMEAGEPLSSLVARAKQLLAVG
ncbi:hypothetical protein BS78_02G376700 [Paspalum vaginatum]|nr:hypothetical protein BS78_02G376700 [Paspalum vaginatum]